MRTARFVITGQDYVDAGRVNFRRYLAPRRLLPRIPAMAGLGAIIGFAIGPNSPGRGYWVGGFVAYAVVVFALIYAIAWALIPRRHRRIFAQHRTIGEPIDAEWGADGITLRSARGEVRYGWRDFHDAREGRGLFLLGLTEQQFHLVPQRALTAADIDDLRGLLVAAGLLRSR